MTIYFRTPENPNPCGGIKKLYDQTDILNKNGIEAYVIHFDKTETFRCDWFENDTKIVYNKTLIQEDDIVVIPEIYDYHMFNLFPKGKKVIFNQNAYNTFRPYGTINDNSILNYNNPDLLGVMVVSEDNKKYLELAFPNNKIYRIHISIDTDKFFPKENKKKQICYMPRKNKQDVDQVISILKLRGYLKDYNFVAIENMTEEELIKTYQESEIFLSFGYPEGCAAPPLEAMACGCIVIGYTGMGCREYMNTDYSFPIEHGDIVSFVKTIEEKIYSFNAINNCPYYNEFENLNNKAIKFIKENYTKEREKSDILNFWNEILNKGNNNVL